MGVLTSREVSPDRIECELDLAALYPDQQSRASFEARWKLFEAASNQCAGLYRKESDRLFYCSESFIPDRADHRPPLLFVVGNPACHSVVEGMCFSREAKARVHRFWRALSRAGLAEFACDTKPGDPLLNQRRKNELYELQYQSPFRVGITVFFSFPTPASGPPWSGVSGVVRLFGRPAVQPLLVGEETRLKEELDAFMGPRGAIVALQRDAYAGLTDGNASGYSLRAARAGTLRGVSKFSSPVPVFGTPPTRLWLSPTSIDVLRKIRSHLSG